MTDDGRVREVLLDAALALELPRVAAVRLDVVVDERRAVGERRLRIGHGRQRLVLDLDELGGVLGRGAAGRDDDRDAVADVARLVRRERQVQRRLRVLGRQPRARQAAVPLLGEVVAGPGGDHVRVRKGRRDVDAADARVRVRAAHDGEVDHAGQAHVVDPLRLAADERQIFLALDRDADHVAGRELRLRAHPATASIASTMFW